MKLVLLLTAVAVALARCDGPVGGPTVPVAGVDGAGDCRAQLVGGTAPALLRSALEVQTVAVCYTGYSALVSGLIQL